MTKPSWQARLLNPVLKTVLKPVVFPKVATQRSMTLTALAFAGVERLRPTLAKASFTPVRGESFAGEWVDTPEPTSRVLLYFHGGGYMIMSPRGYRDFTASLALHCRARVLAVDYRQGAKHPWPAPLTDALASYDYLLAQGIKPEQIMLAGDSAGGHLTLATLLALRDQGKPLPRTAVVLSPWTNMACDFVSHEANRDSDVMLDIDAVRSNAVFQAQGTPLRDPSISPAFADYTGLPPMLIIASTSEILLDDARAARDRARAAGVRADYREWDNVPHVFPTLGPILPEAREAMSEIRRFVEARFN